jgi:adenylate cyclase
MNFRDRPRSVWVLPLIALAITLALLGSDWGGFAASLRGSLFDAYQRAKPRDYQDTRAEVGFSVRVLDADAPSLAQFGPWPWPHAVLAKLADDLHAQGAQLVVFDLPLDRPDPASPTNLIAGIPAGPNFDQARAALQAMPSPDNALATSLTHIATVTGYTLGGSTHALTPKKTISFTGTQDPFAHTRQFTGSSDVFAPLFKASAGTGARNLAADRDGVVRRAPLVFRLNGQPVASLDAEVLRVIENRKRLIVNPSDGGDIFTGARGVTSIDAFHHTLPTAPDGSLWIAYARDTDARSISASALDHNTLAPGVLKNAIVYLGSPDDLVATPLGMRTTASVHAEAMENILLGNVLRRPTAAANAELVCFALCGFVMIFLLARFGVWWAGLFALVAVAGAGAVSWQLFAANHVLLDVLGPGFGIAFVFAAGAAARMLEVAGGRARLHDAFADALSPEAIDRIARKPSLLKLGGENRTVTYLVCGVRGFPELAKSFRDDPVAFTRLLERVFTPLMDEVLSHRGTIERIGSEGFSAFWNAPLDDPEHAIHACEAATGMMEVIARVNEIITHERRIDGAALAPVEIGIGLSTGPAIAGGFRTHGHTTYSAVGECAVLAGRIQALSGTYGPAVIVSEDTRKAAERGFAFLEVDYVALGEGTPVKLYAMLGNPVMRASPKFRALTTFHDHIFQSLRTQQWEKTRELIDQCRKLSGASQKLYDLQLSRVAWYENHPPGADWDGAFRPILK